MYTILLTCLPKIFVYASFAFDTTACKRCAVRENEIIGTISIKVTHQSSHITIVSVINYSFTCQKPYSKANFYRDG